MPLINNAIALAENGLLPDSIVRHGIRKLSEQRLTEISASDCEANTKLLHDFITNMNSAPIALVPELANTQHYEIPAQFFEYCLGKNRKYSSCFWLEDTKTLDEAEENSLRISCEHADLHDGQTILELGCGWGSLTLWMSAHYPNAKITAVSNSNSQREHILKIANERGLKNITVITCDMNTFTPPVDAGKNGQFDRVVSIEMFEHMRNHRVLYGKVYDWLLPKGKFFMHIFVHRSTPYAFEIKGDDDWMSQYFFSGGMMPSDDLPLFFQEKLKLKNRWRWNGTHYEKTANAWLANMDTYAKEITPILQQTYGADAEMWRNRWRIFYMACAELFGYNKGQEWWVGHYQFERPL